MLITYIARRFAKSLRNNAFARFTWYVGIVSVALGCIALTLSFAILNGYEEQIQQTAAAFTSHIEVHPVPGARATINPGLRNIPGVRTLDTTVVREALARTKNGVEGAVLNGVSTLPASVSANHQALLGDGCAVGSELARLLGLHVNDTLVIFASEPSHAESQNQPTPIIFTLVVRDVFQSGMITVDRSYVICNINTLREKLRMLPSEFSMIRVMMDEVEMVSGTVKTIDAMVRPYAYTITYQERYAAVWQWIDLQRKPIPIVLGLITIVAVFTVMSAVLITVVEKIRSIAILRVLGMPARKITMVVLVRGLWVGVIGGAVGSALSYAFCLVQHQFNIITLDSAVYYVSALPVSLNLKPFIAIPLLSIILCLLASAAPMVIALRVQPAKALRFA